MKKLLSVLMVLSMLLVSVFVFANGAAKTVSSRLEGFFLSEEEILEAFGGLSEREMADFSGLYINPDTGCVVISFVTWSEGFMSALSRAKEMEYRLGGRELGISGVTFSYDELLKVNNALVDALNNKREEVEGICGFGIFIDKNAIEISILEGADPGKIIENLNILLKPVLPSYLHSLEQMITLKPGGQYITYTATTNGTTMVRLQKDGSSVQGFASAAVKYYSSTYGSGFITTTHGLSDFNIGTKVYKIHCD